MESTRTIVPMASTVARGQRQKRKRKNATMTSNSSGHSLTTTTTTTASTNDGGAGGPRPRRPRLVWRRRDTENSVLYNLQLDVQALRQEVQSLTQFRQMLMARALRRADDPDGSYVRLVEEYFRVFRQGCSNDPRWQQKQREHRAPLQLLNHAAATIGAGREPAMARTPQDYLQQVMDENIVIGRFVGLEQMMRQWLQYSAVLGPISLRFLDCRLIAGPSQGHHTITPSEHQVLVTSRAQYHLYISLKTIETMFPHVLAQPAIVTRMLGRRISGIGCFDFVFDTRTNRIIRYEFALDFMASLTELLREPSLVARVLDGALISDESFIGDLSEYVAQPEPGPWATRMTTESQDDCEQEAPEPPVTTTTPRSPLRPSFRAMDLQNILSQDVDDGNDLVADVEATVSVASSSCQSIHSKVEPWLEPVLAPEDELAPICQHHRPCI